MAQSFAVPLENVRNVTIVAHVDHGKTSFCDSLLSSNNIISQRLAGKLRFLDSREDEQERGITMESSAVSLRFDMVRAPALPALKDGATESAGGGKKDNEAGPGPNTTAQARALANRHICNLIDTPGHVDFASEVSTASRLCDGALVLVDAVEGVCTQTIAVLRQAWIDRLRPLLVINKLDRLITELKLSPSEAYHHLSQLIEQVNAVMGSFYASDRMEDDLRWREERERRLAQRLETQSGAETPTNGPSSQSQPDQSNGMDGEDGIGEFEEKEDEDIYFAPDRGNVLFASAIDGWAFRLGKFARLYSDKLGIKEYNLRRVLWGDWYLDPKSKRVVGRKKLQGRNLKPMFVQFVLENIWRVYNTVLGEYNPDAVTKIVNALSLKVSPRDLKSKDTRNLLTVIMQQWLPLSTSTFQAIVDVIPSPPQAQLLRLPYMLHPDQHSSSSEPITAQNQMEKALYGCDQSEEVPLVAYVSKMFAVRRKDLPGFKIQELNADEMRRKGKEERERRLASTASASAAGASNGDKVNNESDMTENGEPVEDVSKPLEDLNLSSQLTPEEETVESEDDEVLLGFSRIFSSTLKRSTQLLAVLPKFDSDLPASHPKNEKYVIRVKIQDLYMMMGRELVAVEEVPAGHVCAIGGLEGVVFRNATLYASTGKGISEGEGEGKGEEGKLVNLAGVGMGVAPIVRVALEPENSIDMPKMVKGLQILNQADPCAEYFVQETGEHVILTAGELHLERCLKDLRERFAKCPIQQSPPIVPFRESAVKAPDMAPPKTRGATRGTIHSTLFDGLVTYTIRATPLPPTIIDFLLAHANTIKTMVAKHGDEDARENDTIEMREERDLGETNETRVMSSEQFWQELKELFKKVGGDWVGAEERIWCFGPKRLGANLLLDPIGKRTLRMKEKESLIASAKAEGKSTDEAVASTEDAITKEQLANLQSAEESEAGEVKRTELRLLRDFENSIESGFQMATFQGPLCAEPVVGMAWTVENIEYHHKEEEGKGRTSAVVGALISSVRDSCRAGMLDWSPRIKLAMYTCDIQASTDVLGKVYGVVARRRGRIISEEMKEGTSFFTIRSLIPVVESFGFADEIRKRTSGAASPQLIFSGFETLDQDPFWVPTTIEELEDLGEKADRANVAKAYVDGVRKRKGMFVEKKIVEFAEKQRTLKK